MNKCFIGLALGQHSLPTITEMSHESEIGSSSSCKNAQLMVFVVVDEERILHKYQKRTVLAHI